MTPRSPAAPSPFSRTCSWKSDFLQSLVLRDKREKSYDEFISACPPSPSLVLIPHISIPLHPTKHLSTKQTNGSTDSRLALRTTSLASATSSTETAVGEPGSDTTETGGGLNITQLKADLTAAQQSKTQLQSRIKALSEEVSTLQQKQEQFDKVTIERSKLDRRTKDLEEEVRAKNKHVQELQDEILALTMELNMLTKKEEATRRENGELVERYMAEMAKKAESMNQASHWE